MNDSNFLKTINEFDFLFFTETWLDKKNNISIDGYKSFHCSRPKTNKRAKCSRGGVSIFCKKHLSYGVSIVKSYDQGIVWLKLDKRFFLKFNEDYYFCLTYIPPENSSIYRNNDFDFYSVIENDVNAFASKGCTFVCGDMNSRTNVKEDYVNHDNIYRYINTVPDSNVLNDTILPMRSNQDKVVNAFGNRLLHLCK